VIDILSGLAAGLALGWALSKLSDMRQEIRYRNFMRRRQHRWRAYTNPRLGIPWDEVTYRPDWSPCSQPPNNPSSEP
jgi:hypothetical protein